MIYEKDKQDKYNNLLKAFTSLTKLFSTNNQPYLEYRAMENIYCKSFNAVNLAREDGAFDAKIGKIGIGLKTFGISTQSMEKVAEFNKHSKELNTLSPKNLVNKIANLRNERISIAKNLHSLDSAIYHCIGRNKDGIIIFETSYECIDENSIDKINKTDTSLSFCDKNSEYRYNFSKSVLMKKFSLNRENVIATIPIKIFDDPYEAILKLLEFLPNTDIDNINIDDCVILPLYSTKNKTIKEVSPKSGLNQWNADGRKRKTGEIYIPIPSVVHKIKSDFFPPRDTSFNLKTPDGQVFSAKVCQANSKALMTNPNHAMSNWLLRKVFSLKEQELLTYDKLKSCNCDSVKITKISKQDYEITLSTLDSFEQFVKNTKEGR